MATWMLAAPLSVAALGCVGDIGANDGSFDGSDPGKDPTGCQAGPGVSPLIKLSTRQYANTVRDLLVASGLDALAGEVEPLVASVPVDSTDTFGGLDARISTEHMQAYFNVAVAVGNSIEADPERLRTTAGDCATEATLSSACIDDLLATFGRRAFRRPLTADEAASLHALDDGTRPPAEVVRAIVVTLLLSPSFVNHVEVDGTPIGGDERLLSLDAWEVASRLSYTFWDSMPDDALLDAAQSGALATDDGFAAQLQRVFEHPRTRDKLWVFWKEWFRLDKFTGFASERPAFQALAEGEHLGEPGHDHWADMVQEVQDLTALYTWDDPGTLEDLLTSDVSVTTSADLAHLYGVPAWDGSGAYPRIEDGSRAGILQRSALLASSLEQTNPFHRGSFLRRSILGDALARPDPNSLPPGSLDPPPPSATDTTRERFAAKVAGNEVCAGCHGQFSDLGYVMESFDALGRFRTVEKVFDEQTGELLAELPIDTEATPRVEPSDGEAVDGPAELNRRIVDSGKVADQLAANYFSFTQRRQPESGSGDVCWVEGLRTQLGTSDVTLADVFEDVAENRSFRQRRVGEP